jgi:hypothetical protein
MFGNGDDEASEAYSLKTDPNTRVLTSVSDAVAENLTTRYQVGRPFR